MSVSVPHAIAVWRRNAAIYKRTWLWNILPNFFEPVFYLVAIGVGLGGLHHPDGRYLLHQLSWLRHWSASPRCTGPVLR